MPGETEDTLRDKLGSSAGTSAWTAGGGSSTQNHHTGQSGGSYGGGEREARVPYGGDPYGGYSTAQEQAAASLQAAGAVTSGALGGQALWNKLPVGMAEKILRGGGDPNLYANEYFSSFAEGTQAYSPSGIISITGEGGIPAYKGRDPKTGELIPWNKDDWQYELANKYKVVNPYFSGVGGGGVGGGSGWGGGYGGGGGSGGGYGFSMQQDPMQQGYQRGQVGPGSLQEQVNQIYLGMSNLNAAPGFNKNRGGIVSLVQ